MKIRYQVKQPRKEEYFKLFLTTGWNNEYNFSSEDMLAAIRKSWYMISAYVNNRLIGYGRVISDGIHHALIADIMVHPDFQGTGIGSMILNKLSAKCKKHNIRDIQLFSARGKVEFYKKAGFTPRPDNAPGMELK